MPKGQPEDKDMAQALAAHQAEERHGGRLGPFIQDVVYGGNDGIVTTFAVVAATAGAALPQGVVVIVGLANLLADASSMGMGAFLGLRSERDQHLRIRKEEEQEIREIPELERAEIRQAFAKKGFHGADLDRVVEVITSDEKVWVDTMMMEEHGLTSESTDKPALHGLITFVSFILFGSIPLMPYLFSFEEASRFPVAIGSTFIALAALGATRSAVTRENLFRGPLEIMAGGALCAAFAYGVGAALKGVFGV